MKKTAPTYNDYIIFPGTSSLQKDAVCSLREPENSYIEPPVNIIERDKYYIIDIVMPGISKEDCLIKVHDDILSVQVKCKKKICGTGEKYCLHEFDNTYLTRKIVLPKNADPTFITAKYTDGILNIKMSKADHKTEEDEKTIYI